MSAGGLGGLLMRSSMEHQRSFHSPVVRGCHKIKVAPGHCVTCRDRLQRVSSDQDEVDLVGVSCLRVPPSRYRVVLFLSERAAYKIIALGAWYSTVVIGNARVCVDESVGEAH
eukprot:6468627-Amphidinium_carterae.3